MMPLQRNQIIFEYLSFQKFVLLSICHPFAIRLLSSVYAISLLIRLCYPYAVRMLSFCNPIFLLSFFSTHLAHKKNRSTKISNSCLSVYVAKDFSCSAKIRQDSCGAQNIWEIVTKLNALFMPFFISLIYILSNDEHKH